ncbi:MAG: MBL fold metallo-hydrolase [Chloroflexota bacterium]
MYNNQTALSRRRFLQMTGAVGGTLALAACVPLEELETMREHDGSHGEGDKHDGEMTMHGDGMMAPEASESMSMESGSTVSIYAMEGASIHTYTGGPAGNGTYIVEGENSLVLVDGQFLAPVAQEFRSYADGLEKSIDRLILTHEHPDHWFGLGAAFEDVAIHTSAGTQAFLNESGPATLEARAESMGAVNNYVSIENLLPDGGETVDGIAYEYRVYQDAEADEQVVAMLPDQGVMLIGDLIYNNWHLVLSQEFDNWISYLEELKDLDGYSLVLPGHGLPGGKELFGDTIDYLTTARDLFGNAEGPDDFQAKMLEVYPDREGAFFWDLILGRLYPQS